MFTSVDRPTVTSGASRATSSSASLGVSTRSLTIHSGHTRNHSRALVVGAPHASARYALRSPLIAIDRSPTSMTSARASKSTAANSARGRGVDCNHEVTEA